MTRFTLLVFALAACGGSDHATPDSNTKIDAAPDAAPAWPGVVAIPLTSPDGSFWGPQVTVGTQTFMMDLDTGSTTIGVAGATCTSCNTVGVSPLYMPSTYATNLHKTASTQYADGSGWSGDIYSDSTGMGQGSPAVQLALVDITQQTDFFIDNTYQGIFGMGGPDNAEPNTDSYFTALTATGEPGIMAFELCDTNGLMWLGGFDMGTAAAAPAYTPLLPIDGNNPYYAIDITSMSVGTTKVGTGKATFQAPVVDTGTTLFYVPTAVDNATLAAINGSSGFQALFGSQRLADDGCVTAAGVTPDMVDAMLPPLTIAMPNMTSGGPDVSVTVAPMKSYMMDGGGGMYCYGMYDGGTVDATTMGDTIMRAFITIIDVDHHQVGFAPELGCGLAPRRPRNMTTFHPHVPHHPLRRQPR